jgi:hypothetical protein
MPTLAAYSTLVDQVQHELRIPITNTTERAKIQSLMSYVYGDICAKAEWWWLMRRSVVNTEPKITTGTVAVTAGSTTATLTAAPTLYAVNVSVANYVLVIIGNTDSNAVYRVSAHTAGTTALTLDGLYTGTTAATATYRLYKVSYDLPADCAKLLHVYRYGVRTPLERMGIEDLTYLQQTNQLEGKPSAYSIYDFATTGTPSSLRQLQIYPYPDLSYRLDVSYKAQSVGDISTDLDLPIDYQQVLIYGALARGYPIFHNDLERGGYYQSLFNDLMALMTSQQREYASDHPGIATDMRGYRNGRVRATGRRSLGPWFDVLPNIP